MTLSNDVFDRLTPAHEWKADWPDVLERAGVASSGRFVAKRRLIVVLVVLAAVLVPLAALGAANDWWFLKFGGAPTPTTAPIVVKEGEWDGHPWQLIAYPSTTDGLCISVTPKGASSVGAAMSCGPFAGVERTPETKASAEMSVTYLSGGATPQLPAYIVGPVIDKAATVEIRFRSGEVLRVPTFAATGALAHVRFYATQLPSGGVAAAGTSITSLEWIAGLDGNGDVVACLAPSTAKDGISALSDCRGP